MKDSGECCGRESKCREETLESSQHNHSANHDGINTQHSPDLIYEKRVFCPEHAKDHDPLYEYFVVIDDGGECEDCVANNERKYDLPDPDSSVVQGGQGRTPEEVESAGWTIWMCFLILLMAVAVAMVVSGCSLSEFQIKRGGNGGWEEIRAEEKKAAEKLQRTFNGM